MKKRAGWLMRDGRDAVGQIWLRFESVMLPDGRQKIAGQFALSPTAMLALGHYSVCFLEGGSGQLIVDSICDDLPHGRIVNFVGTLPAAAQTGPVVSSAESTFVGHIDTELHLARGTRLLFQPTSNSRVPAEAVDLGRIVHCQRLVEPLISEAGNFDQERIIFDCAECPAPTPERFIRQDGEPVVKGLIQFGVNALPCTLQLQPRRRGIRAIVRRLREAQPIGCRT